MPNRRRAVSGGELLNMLKAGTDWLEQNVRNIDTLNVFPVPDRDTGTNMLLSMRSALAEADSAAGDSAGAVAQSIARGSLTGARGNSGVLLSMFWKGLAYGLKGKTAATSGDLARAMQKSSAFAYRALSRPVEGTILTVIRDIAAAARRARRFRADLVSFMEKVVGSAEASVANTPKLLDVLRQSEVVDAGGAGLYIILAGALRYLKGEKASPRKPAWLQAAAGFERFGGPEAERLGRFCTEFLLSGVDLKLDNLRAGLEKRGQSLIVAGDRKRARVHIHTADPHGVIAWAEAAGRVERISIRDMAEQQERYLSFGVVAVAAGEGLADIFRTLGAGAVVDGDEAPRAEDIAEAVANLPARDIIILPNSSGALAATEGMRGAAGKRLAIVASRTIPQGIAALVALSFGQDFESNIRLMTAAMRKVQTVELRRSAPLPGQEDRLIGFLEGRPVAEGKEARRLLAEILERANLENAELLSLYYGGRVDAAEAAEASRQLAAAHPGMAVETHYGGQPLCDYIISIE